MRRRGLVAGALIAWIILCGCVAAGGLVISGPSLACVRPVEGEARPDTSARTLVSGGRERCCILYVPPDYGASHSAPVVISLHGFQSKPEVQRFTDRWDKLADREGFLLVYPQGSAFPLRWNAGPMSNIENIDDVGFIRDVIADLEEIADVDPARVYVSGFSNGGGLAHRIACELADRVAAFGIVSGVGVDLPGGCSPSRPVPLIAFWGTADRSSNYYGGTSTVSRPLAWLLDVPAATREYPAVEAWVKDWADRNACDFASEATLVTEDIRVLRYTGCQQDAEVVLYTIAGGGHTWPGGPDFYVFGKTSGDIDASAKMWEFFEGHTLEFYP